MPSVYFVNRYYSPDFSATSQILTDVAEHLASNKIMVTVLSSRISYDAKTIFPKREKLNNVKIIRTWSSRFGRNSMFGRIFDYLTFYVSVSISLLVHLKKKDILILKTDPPMMSIPIGMIARLKKVKLVNWLQDIFPEVAQELSVLPSDSVLTDMIKSMRDRSLKRAHMNIAIGFRMKEYLLTRGVRPEQIRVIENFTDDRAIGSVTEKTPELRALWNLDASDFVVGYSGNLGRSHDLDTILDAATILRTETDIKFLFVGGGFLKQRLTAEIEKRRLTNVLIKPYQPRSKLPQSLALPDIHWVSLNPRLEGYIVPSKVYGIAAAARPLLMIGDKEGEIGRMIDEFEFGACVPPGSSEDAATFILKAKNSRQKTQRLGINARSLIDKRSSRGGALDDWFQLINNINSAD